VVSGRNVELKAGEARAAGATQTKALQQRRAALTVVTMLPTDLGHSLSPAAALTLSSAAPAERPVAPASLTTPKR
jgi:hypothetical protein